MFKKLLRKFSPNPLDQIIKKANALGHKTFLIYWNRGLGDIPLGLYALVHRIRASISDATITFLTRANLHDGFVLMGGVEIIVEPDLKRGDQVDIYSLIDTSKFDVVIEKADPTYWVSWQLGTLTPLLRWQNQWNDLCQKYHLDPEKRYVGAHVQTETNQYYETCKNWPLASWKKLFKICKASELNVLLFGYYKDPTFDAENVIDLRGETPLFDLLSIIKNYCEAMIAPDSGVSSMVYFLDVDFPIKHISLWSKPNRGILKQNVPSPNSLLEHIPIIGEKYDISTIQPEEVYAHLQKSR